MLMSRRRFGTGMAGVAGAAVLPGAAVMPASAVPRTAETAPIAALFHPDDRTIEQDLRLIEQSAREALALLAGANTDHPSIRYGRLFDMRIKLQTIRHSLDFLHFAAEEQRLAVNEVYQEYKASKQDRPT